MLTVGSPRTATPIKALISREFPKWHPTSVEWAIAAWFKKTALQRLWLPRNSARITFKSSGVILMAGKEKLDLTVRGETIERLYQDFKSEKFLVNREYQRKLVWFLSEKENFVDSIAREFPIPIILLAQKAGKNGDYYEIIDGMQRLDAIFSFIENRFPLNGKYFDLESTAVTKQLLDERLVEQKKPSLSRRECVTIASYQVPLSIFESPSNEPVNEVFRRINSGGRKLSRQDLRVAGALGEFARIVRHLSSVVRGDISPTDSLLLNNMGQISLTSKDLSYGIDIETVFWVANGIITKDQLRQSQDEELISDMLAYMLLDEPPASRSEYLNDYFDPGESDASKERYNQIEGAVKKFGHEEIVRRFTLVYDELKLILDEAGKTFTELIFGDPAERAPRYFQVVFLALHELLVRKSKKTSNRGRLIRKLSGSAESITIQEGGRWGAEARHDEVIGLAAKISNCFVDMGDHDPSKGKWISQLEAILTSSLTEQSSFDFKIGFVRLDGSGKFDSGCFQGVLEELVGMANISKKRRGYLIVGVADTKSDADRVKSLYGIKPRKFANFWIVGLQHEIDLGPKDADKYIGNLINSIENSKLSEPLRSYVCKHAKFVQYYELPVLVLEVMGQETPSHIDGQYFVRHLNKKKLVAPQDFGALFSQYSSSE